MDGPRDCHIEWSQTEKDKYNVTFLYVESNKKGINELIYKTEIESQM